LGYTNIEQAGCGQSALTMMREAAAAGSAFDICFIDMIMPVMDGWRLAAEIHNDNAIKHTDLILMVPHGLLGAEAKMTLLKWFKAYINKPVKRRLLADSISLALSELQELEAVPEESETEAEPQKVNAEEKKPLVLIAEDHPVNQELFSLLLDKLGYDSILANDGQDALEKFQTQQVDIVFMDIQMPRMNGYQAAQALRARGCTKPIIAVTASALPDERERCMKAGIDDILVKPFKRSGLEAMLRKWTSGAEAGQKSADSVFDAGELPDAFLDDEETLMSLIARFIERAQAQLKAIPELEKAEDWESALRESHTIKGTAFTMGGMELGKAAARLESAHKNIDKAEMSAAYPPLVQAFERYKKEAEAFIRVRR